jgi:tetratricopeptide (TPR) repeat protein
LHAHDDIAQASFADLEIDFRQYRASKSGRPVALSPREFEILRHFLRRRGEVVTREELLEQVFEDDAAHPKWILTVHRYTLGVDRSAIAQQDEGYAGDAAPGSATGSLPAALYSLVGVSPSAKQPGDEGKSAEMKRRIIHTFCVLLWVVPALMAQDTATPKTVDKAAAYYHFSMGHLYSELASQYGNRGEYFKKAIDHYRQAIKADPNSSLLVEELADLYIQGGRIRDAVLETEEGLKQNPNDLNLRRLLGRLYTRLIGDTQQNRINEEMLKRAIEQYAKITEKEPKDTASWVVLGRLHKVAQNSPESEKAYKKALENDPDSEEALTGLAMVYADVGDTKSASELLKKVTDKNPSVRTLAALAATYEQLRDHASAAATLRKALEMAPQNAEIKRGLAQNLFLSEKYDEALELFEKLAGEDGKDALSWLRISQIYRQKRDWNKAREASAKAVEIDPGNIEIRYNEIGLLEAEGKSQEAIDTLRGLLAVSSRKNYSAGEKANRVTLLERLGYLYRGVEQYSHALDAFRQMAQLDEEQSARASVHIIETHRLAREVAKAYEEAKAAVQKHPKDRNLLAMYGYVAADAGKSAEAERVARDLVKDNKDREAWLTLAQVYERTKNFSEMGKALDEAEKLSGDKEEKEGVYFMRGAMYEKMKKHDLAEAEFRKVLASNPNNSSASNYLGYMLADRNVRLAEAYDLIRKAVDLDPQNGAYLDSLGWVYFRMNKLTEAEEYLKRALEKTSRDPTVHDHLGDVYMQQGRLKDAISQWERSVKEWESVPASEHDPNELAKVQKKLERARVRLAKESKQN